MIWNSIQMRRERIYQLDLIRILACLMVIIMHAPKPIAEGNSSMGTSLLLVGTSYLCAPCIGLFFMVSGALLLPVREAALPFIRKRMGKVAGPTLAASLFYLIVHSLQGDGVNWLKALLSLPFSAQGTGILWFMYTLIGLYLLAPIISRWLNTPPSLQELRFYTFLWLLTLCYPLISLFAETNEAMTGVLYYFGGYAGYFLLGYALLRYPSMICWRYLAPAFLVALVAPVVCKVMGWTVDFYRMFWYTSIFVVILCATLFKALMQWGGYLRHGEGLKRFLARLSDLTFGVYLLHFFILRDVLWNWSIISSISNYYLQTLVLIVLTTIFTFALCAVISYIPGSSYLIGYHHKLKPQK